MFGLTTTRHLQDETDALKAQIAGLREQRDQAFEELSAFKAAAKTAARMTEGVALQQLADAAKRHTEVEEPLDRIVRPRPDSSTTIIARERDRARALDDRLALLQAAVLRCTCGGAA